MNECGIIFKNQFSFSLIAHRLWFKPWAMGDGGKEFLLISLMQDNG